jgi:hypothetical protein
VAIDWLNVSGMCFASFPLVPITHSHKSADGQWLFLITHLLVADGELHARVLDRLDALADAVFNPTARTPSGTFGRGSLYQSAGSLLHTASSLAESFAAEKAKLAGRPWQRLQGVNER